MPLNTNAPAPTKDWGPFIYLSAAFVAALITANMVSGKIISLGGLFVPAGVLAYSITFAVTDTLCEIWGRERTQAVVNAGFVVQLLVWVLIVLAIQMPAAPFWTGQPAYATVLGQSHRIILASLLAYALSQSFDLWVFSRLKTRFGGRLLWLRNNVSTFLSQTLDTVVFITAAFYGTMDLLPLIGGQLIVKWIIAMLDTPVVYALVWLIRRRGHGTSEGRVKPSAA